MKPLKIPRLAKFDAVSFGLGLLVLLYLGCVNYSVAFTTMDDFEFALKPWSEIFVEAWNNSRPSQVLFSGISYLLAFNIPDSAGLTPRFLSMLALFASLILLVKKMGFDTRKSIAISGFTLITHQIDWQHNGLISYFGIYNLLLALFIGSIHLENTAKSLPHFALTVFMSLLSFASELFFGMSVIYLLIRGLSGQSLQRLRRSPITLACLIYLAFSILVLLSANGTKAVVMRDYLTGGYRHGIFSMMQAALLYLFYSIPFSEDFTRNHDLGMLLGAGVLSIFCLAAGIALRGILSGNRNSESRSTLHHGTIMLIMVIMVCALGVVPEFLMGIQPLKITWILQGQSHRYVFSLYTWIALLIAIFWMIGRTGTHQPFQENPRHHGPKGEVDCLSPSDPRIVTS